ncbi:MAG: hypothetical protein IT236_18880 [Bacteroidia bacterium]|nr:hypothetical protein [Bacteroidia bacterium]
MNYFESELIFEETKPGTAIKAKAFKNHYRPTQTSNTNAAKPTQLLGITVRIGNQPLVINLKELVKLKDDSLQNFTPFLARDYYLIVHTISAMRTQGNAKVDELHYHAEAIEPDGLQTVELIPGTRLKEIFKANMDYEASLSLTGEALLNIPAELSQNLIPQLINLGGNMQLQICNSAHFIGKLTFSVQLPVIQAAGIASNFCSWVLNPDENKTPLLGDQLLIQTVSVPKGTAGISYKLKGLVKVDKGLFWKQQEKATPEYRVKVEFDRK